MTQSISGLLPRLDWLADAARRNKDQQFNNLLHHINPALLHKAFMQLNRKAAKGVDEQSWDQYQQQDLMPKLIHLNQRIQSGRYKAKPVKRIWIPKSNGDKRPIGITSIEDKIVQQAVTWILESIYEQDFLGFSYGFRPKRSQHDALDALFMSISVKKVSWILDADLKAFFDTLNHDWLMKFLGHRIADPRILRLVKGWLSAGVMDGKEKHKTHEGTPQGAVISPLLANIYLHYVLDLWVHQWRKRYATGEIYIVRYADDFVIGAQYQREANALLRVLKQRLHNFSLKLNEEKTKLIEFGRFARSNRKERRQPKPETFDFLGFTHICGERRSDGGFQLMRLGIKSKVRALLDKIKTNLRRHINSSPYDVGLWIRRVLNGYFNYFSIPGNKARIAMIRTEVCKYWLKVLRRRSQKGQNFNWLRIKKFVMLFIPHTRIRHPYPNQRFQL
jgi:RNA-directed DNA polymerase